IRKQYNWGRQPFEGGAILPDNQTVYLGADATPGLFTKFVADTPGDFTRGTTYVYKHDLNDSINGNWLMMDNMSLDEMLYFADSALSRGATMYNRLEWVTYYDGKVYMSETGRDNLGSRFVDAAAMGGVLDYHWLEPVRARHPNLEAKTDDQVLDFVKAGFFNDYYGRVLVYDIATDKVETYLNGGPFYEESPEVAAYPNKHLTNPDGLNVMVVNGQPYMVINEDLNGTSNARVPAGINNRTCEAFLLDMNKSNPTVDDLVRISIVPVGAEVTGAQATPDGKTLLLNSQHPSTDNPFPYNNSLTYAITGWDDAVAAITSIDDQVTEVEGLKFWADHVQRVLRTNERVDMALYDIMGRRLRVIRNVTEVDVHDLQPGAYIMKAYGLESQKAVGAKFILE
ncbi:MAG: alkaline phosphatase PhoX, partial [Bacteroidota bacterium]